MNQYKKLFVMLLLGVVAVTANAQDKYSRFNPIQYGVVSLGIAPDARAGAMGDVGVATEADANSQYWNPAKYPFNVARAGVSASYTPWLRKLVNDINLANVAGFYRIGNYNALSASLRYFSLGEVMLGEEENAMSINPYEMAIDLGYSRMLSECFSMGVVMRFIYSDITYDYTSESKAGMAFAADIAMYRNGYFMMGNRECSFAWGLNINNIGSKISYGGDENTDFIPTNLRLGLNFTVPFNAYNKLSITADANKLLVPSLPRREADEADKDYIDRVQKKYYDMSPITGIFRSFSDAPGGFKEEMQEIQLSAGLEYTYNDRFMVRAGYHHEAANKGNRKYFTAGAGFHMSIFTVDAAYVFSTSQTNPLDQTMRFSLGFDLDGLKDMFGRGKTSRRRR